MAAVDFSSGSFIISSTATANQVSGGATAIDQFEPVYRSGSSYLPADKGTEAAAEVIGIAGTATGSAGDFFTLISKGSIRVKGATPFVKDTLYFLGNEGAIIPESDLATNDWLCLIGIAKSTTELILAIKIFGFQHD